MELTDLINISRENNEELYDLTEISFRYNRPVVRRISSSYITEEDDEMRLDTISNKLYDDVDNIDFICNLNSIKNPLSIKRGLNLITVPIDNIAAFRSERTTQNNEVRRIISNKRKSIPIDPNRQKFLDQKSQSLPPTVTNRDYIGVKYKNGKISVGGNIFNT